MEKLITITTNFMPVVREATLESKPHLVAQVTLLVEGVHNGVLYTAAELSKYPSAWNGIPLPIDHPRVGGVGVTANDPTIIEEQCVGNLFNVIYDPDKARLVGEVWINIDKAQSLAPAVLSVVRSGRKLEISTGLYTDDDGTPGVWNGQQFAATVMNFRPDHLALLLDGVGACSIADGCGVNINKEVSMVVNPSLKNRVGLFIRNVFGLSANEDSHDALWSKLSSAVSSLDTDSWDHWIREVYDDYIIYQASGDKNPSEVGSAGTRFLYKRSYTVGADEEVVLSDDAQEVKEEKTYVPVGNDVNALLNLGNQPKEKVTMQNNDATVQALIACESTKFTKKDAEWLTALSAEQLETMLPVVNEDKPDAVPPIEDKVVPPIEDKPDAVPPIEDAQPITLEAYIAAAPSEVAETLRRSVARDEAEKNAVVDVLIANARCKFTKEQLVAKPLDELINLAELGNVPMDFSAGAGSAPVINEDGPGPMPPVFVKKEMV